MNDRLPNWTEELLTGLAFWVGYKRQYYRHYPLSEGAIVAESLSLLNAKISSQKLLPEVQYKNLCPVDNSNNFNLERADIVITNTKSKKNEDLSGDIDCVIEVKRYSAGEILIERDLERLAKLLYYSNKHKIRCFLIVVAQNKKPKKFITGKGNAEKKNLPLSFGYEASVRRVCKATASFGKNSMKHANYAYLIEVMRKRRSKL